MPLVRSEDQLPINDCSILFLLLRTWTLKVLALIRQHGDSLKPEWEQALEIVFLEGKVAMREKHTELRNRIASTDDLLNPKTWLTDIADREARGLMFDASDLAMQSQLFFSNGGYLHSGAYSERRSHCSFSLECLLP